jgi:tRNA(Arg) A34 adenosine deaminase TadA
MTKTEYMRRAIELSRAAMTDDGVAPFGAVVVKDGRIVGEGVNQVVQLSDPTSHGEIEAIRDAGRHLGTWDLSGCDLYTSCEPCEMCVAAIVWARIDRMFYANTLDDCRAIGFDLSHLRATVRADLAERDMPSERLLPEEAREVLEAWRTTATYKALVG